MVEREGIFSRATDWLIANRTGLSLLALTGIIAWQTYSGMYDWTAVSTRDVLQAGASWAEREVELTNVSIRKYEITEQGPDTFVKLWLVNGATNPSPDETPLVVYARMSTESARPIESFAWSLKNGLNRLASVRIAIKKDLAVLREYWLVADASWFSTPYLGAVITMNRFCSLRTSVWTGVVVQALVYIGIALLVSSGLFLILPNLE